MQQRTAAMRGSSVFVVMVVMPLPELSMSVKNGDTQTVSEKRVEPG